MTAMRTAYTQVRTNACSLCLAEDASDLCVGTLAVLPAEVIGDLAAVLVLLLAEVVEIGTVAVVVVELVDGDGSVLADVTLTLGVVVEYCSQSVTVFKRLWMFGLCPLNSQLVCVHAHLVMFEFSSENPGRLTE